ncbi:extracellular solute-binding protein [Siccirubricoccus sp. KC 17139]|uniref:Extracellular solute-binding protein n=1 Tax=Siccirubricoccus soli TaxID=2899147 RepID=A0ABT1D1E5_9PROT|nr:extracellular solute-binding protein [Siccirubricoccus soli]MCO6414855.1 extracellular solute-binding protein [Siccirubricoccus soli]MCP2680985.1 extracellular solute-binding protein [Siccirubricoccus soli]
MPQVSRRGVLGTGLGATVASFAIIRRGAAENLPQHERELYEAAKREGEITWYSGQYSAEGSEAVGRGFMERYPGVRCNVVRSTSQVAFQRLSQDARARVAQCDVFSSTNTGHFTMLKREGRLLQFRPRNADGLLEAIRVADPDNYYQTSFLGLFLLGHNVQKVKEADAPKSWTDVLDPKWKDQVAVGHPGFSGAIGVWAVQMRKMYGWDYFKRLERNRPQIGRSSQDPVTLLNAGERSIGICVPAGTMLLSMSRGNPLRLIYPTEGTLATIAPSAIPSNAPHPNAAKLFMEYQTGPEMSQVIRRLFGEPLRPDVPAAEGSLPLDQVKLIAPSQDEQEKGVPEVRELWRDTFGI